LTMMTLLRALKFLPVGGALWYLIDPTRRTTFLESDLKLSGLRRRAPIRNRFYFRSDGRNILRNFGTGLPRHCETIAQRSLVFVPDPRTGSEWRERSQERLWWQKLQMRQIILSVLGEKRSPRSSRSSDHHVPPDQNPRDAEQNVILEPNAPIEDELAEDVHADGDDMVFDDDSDIEENFVRAEVAEGAAEVFDDSAGATGELKKGRTNLRTNQNSTPQRRCERC